MSHVGLYRATPDEETLSDLRVRQTLGGQVDDLELGVRLSHPVVGRLRLPLARRA